MSILAGKKKSDLVLCRKVILLVFCFARNFRNMLNNCTVPKVWVTCYTLSKDLFGSHQIRCSRSWILFLLFPLFGCFQEITQILFVSCFSSQEVPSHLGIVYNIRAHNCLNKKPVSLATFQVSSICSCFP